MKFWFRGFIRGVFGLPMGGKWKGVGCQRVADFSTRVRVPQTELQRPMTKSGWGLGWLCVLGFLMAGCGTSEPPAKPVRTPEVWTLKVERMLKHDKGDFTQGLVIHDGELLEGTGKRGFSRLMRKNLRTGHTVASVRLEPKYFGEGVAVFGETIYQLTWESGILLQYDRKTLELNGLLSYEGQGWGLTHDGKEMIMSDGSDTLQFRDPRTFEVVRRQPVTMAGEPLKNLNELEFVDGLVFANVWGTNGIVVIDPANGEVVARMDCSALVATAKKAHPGVEVLNGIAVYPDTGHLLVTGKLWPMMFEVSVVKSR